MYSTILLYLFVVPNAWLPRDRKEVPRREIVSRIDPSRNWQALRIRNKNMYQYIVQTGYTIKIPDEFISIRDGKTTITQQQPYVSVCQYDHASTD